MDEQAAVTQFSKKYWYLTEKKNNKSLNHERVLCNKIACYSNSSCWSCADEQSFTDRKTQAVALISVLNCLQRLKGQTVIFISHSSSEQG